MTAPAAPSMDNSFEGLGYANSTLIKLFIFHSISITFLFITNK